MSPSFFFALMSCHFAEMRMLCLDPKFLQQKTSHRMYGHIHGVLNGVYLKKIE
jgi:hypothetical protein